MKKVRKLKEEVAKILEKLQHALSNNEYIVVSNKIDSYMVLIPRLLAKDNKKKDSK